jgi:peptidoglycan/xylan/chitin deacetylase (PgdA/CDA1 family)
MTTLLLLLLLLVALFFVPLYVVYKPPAALIRHFSRRWPDVLWQVDTEEKMIALTIDDAPSAHTGAILDVLRANDARATFFAIGSQVAGREETLREVIRGGHELGNHAMRDEPSRSLSDAALEAEIYTVRDMLTRAYEDERAEPPEAYFRPGSGFFSDRMRRLVGKIGYRLVLGGIYPHDPQIPYPGVNANHILSMLRPGAIIICHDRRSWTVPMLEKVLPEARRRGYKLVTVTELLAAAQS